MTATSGFEPSTMPAPPAGSAGPAPTRHRVIPAPAAAPADHRSVPLADLSPGTRAVILAVSQEGSAATARRLGELGFTPGTTVEVIRRAPLRDPVVYRVKDYDICLRRAQAALVRAAVVDR